MHVSSRDAGCCSYLAIVAALCTEADMVFIPEDPIHSNWPEKLCTLMRQVWKRKLGCDERAFVESVPN